MHSRGVRVNPPDILPCSPDVPRQPNQPDLASTLLNETRNQNADDRHGATEKHQVLSLNKWGAVATRVCGNYEWRRDKRSDSSQSYGYRFVRVLAR